MKLRGWAAALGLGLMLAGCGPQGAAPITAFEGRLADWARDILADSPETATAAGVSEEAAGGPYAGRLDDRSALAAEALETPPAQIVAAAAAAPARALTTPMEAFGHEVGADYRLITYTQFERYLHTLAGQSDRMKLLEIGRSSEGRTQYLSVVSSPQNLANIDRYQEIARRLLARAPKGFFDWRA